MSSLVAGEAMRVLLISPHAEQSAAVDEALAGAGAHRLYWVSQPELALARSQGLEPHVIIVDGELPDATRLIGQLRAADDTAAIVTLVPHDDRAMGIAQSALLAGANAFLVQPLKGPELGAALRQLLSRAPAPASDLPPATGRVIVFCGPKGGTGRTTLAINIAISLRQATSEPVVLVDADYAAPAIDVALNLRGERDIRDLMPKLNQLDAELINSVLVTHGSGVKALLAPPPDVAQDLPTLPQVQQVVAWLKRIFPWVVVDLGLPLDEAAFAFLDASDRVIVSVMPEMVGVRNARLMLAQFAARGYPPEKVWPLLNREGMLAGLTREEVENYLGRPLAHTAPNDQMMTTETINSGVPIVMSNPRRPVSGAYRTLARRLVADRQGASEAVAEAAAEPVGAATIAPVAPPRRERSRARRPLLAAAGTLVVLLLVFGVVGQLLTRRSAGQPPQTATALQASAAAETPGSPPAEPSLTPAPATAEPPAVVQATATPTATATRTPTATRTATAAPTAMPTATETAAPTATETVTEVPTETPTASPTATATRAPTRTPLPRPTATVAVTLSDPALVGPAPGEAVQGVVTFRWLPTGPLPAAAAYEVVWWNEGEDPAAARGIAPPITGTSLQANLDTLYSSGQFKTSTLRWTVLIVRTEPYLRLTQPGIANSSPLVYQPGGAPPPPPR